MFGPLEQFEITINNLNSFHAYKFLLTVENISLYESFKCAFFLFLDDFILSFTINDFILSFFRVLLIWFILTWITVISFNYIFPTKWSLFFENIYSFLATMFKEQVGYRGQKYFPFISSLFFFIVLLNLAGMIPYEGALSSQAVLALSLSFIVFLILTLIGFARQKFKFLLLFIPPKGIPLILIPLLIVIEIVSYLSRGISLGVRLFANIMAGHTLLFIFSGFILLVNGGIGLSIFIVIFLISCLEFMIAVLQAYVFFVLTLIYFRDSIEVSH